MKLLKNHSAEILRQKVIDAAPPVPAGDPQRPAALGRAVLVRCTSATAANTSGVGAQCYPGVIVDPKASTSTQTESGTVWLTVYGAGVQAKKPKSGNVYQCLLLGDVEAATNDTRPRAVAVLADARAADCSDMLGLVRADKCLRMTIVEVQGACDCIDTTQTADLTYDAGEAALVSADLLYGCPPGVTTTLCGTGAPNKWNIVVAGFGAPNTNLNQSYTITHTTGEVWAGTKGGVTVTATRISGGWTLSLADGTVTVTYDTTGMDVCCSTVTFDLLDDDGTTTAPATLSMTVATACGDGPSYTPRLERVSGDCGLCLKFTWVPTAGSGSRVIPWKQVGCGEDADGQPYIEFATDDPVICTGADGAACTGNRVVVRLTCTPCTEWVGGWYCYKGPGVADPACVYLTADPSDGGAPWAGPFDTEGECDCNSPPVCCPNGFPLRLCVSIGSSFFPELGNQSFEAAYGETIRAGQSTQFGITCETHGSVTGPGWQFCREYDVELGGRQWTTLYILPCAGGTFYIQIVGIDSYDGFEFYTDGVIGDDDAGECTLPLTGSLPTGPVSWGSLAVTISETSGDCGPVARSWNCIPGVGCVEVFDGSGEYASEAECTASCGGAGTPPSPGGPGCLSCGLLGETPTLVIPDGTYAGTYVADGPWAAGAYPGETTFTIGGSTVEVYCDLGGTAYLDVHPDFGGGAIGGTSSCGPPVVMTFAGSGVGAVGNATVTT